MKIKRDQFTVLIDAPTGGGGGWPPAKKVTDVENINDDPVDPPPPQPPTPGDGDDDTDDTDVNKDGNGDGDGEGGEESDDDGNGGSGTPTVEVEDIPKKPLPDFSKMGGGPGEVISPEDSKKMQADLGVPYEAPPSREEIIERVRNLEPELQKHKTTKGDWGDSYGKGRLLPNIIANMVRPVIDWKNLLKRYIGSILSQKTTPTLPKRRFVSSGQYFGTKKPLERDLKKAMIAVDTSMSMGNDEILTMINEIKGLAESNRIKQFEIIYFDTRIEGNEKLTKDRAKKYAPTSTPGGGGTSFREPIAYMDKAYKEGDLSLAVFMTDGYADLDLPVPRCVDKFIWVILDNRSWKAPWGNKCVYIETQKQ